MNFLPRILSPVLSRSFFLFGARNTGKSTLLARLFNGEGTLWVNLLDPDTEERYAVNPQAFKQEVLAAGESVRYVVMDEIQKLPKLLNLVHQLIETTDKIFVMTGSSARKLKYGGANLLAGRAFVYNLFPLTAAELGEKFDLDMALHWGTLPSVVLDLHTPEEKIRFLQAYAQTYLKEEIWFEQFIRRIDPFRKFLEVAAQCNGQILNMSNIARDVGVDDKTIRQYYAILEDTLMGFMLEPWHGSFRKRLHARPKFYFFDIGVCRALSRMLTVPLAPATSYYGDVFEQFIILETMRLASYHCHEYRFSYLRTQHDAEIDLIVERPGQKLLCIEIKSTDNVREDKIATFAGLVKDIENCEAVCISRDPRPKRIGEITVLPWREALRIYFGGG